MTSICRTPRCENDAVDDLGFCLDCGRAYIDRRIRTSQVCEALYAQRPELFERLSGPDAQHLAEHLVAHASQGERGFYARFWAGMDFVRETRELRARRAYARSVMLGRCDMRSVPRGVLA